MMKAPADRRPLRAARAPGPCLNLAFTRVQIIAALRRNVRDFIGIGLPENSRMFNLLRDLKRPERLRYEEGVEYVEIDLLPRARPHDPSRGLGGLRRALMGSVSSSIVRHAHCPVMVVRGEPLAFPTKLLLSTDGSKDAQLAAKTASELSEKLDCGVARCLCRTDAGETQQTNALRS